MATNYWNTTTVSNSDYRFIKLKKAGQSRWLGKGPVVRGVASPCKDITQTQKTREAWVTTQFVTSCSVSDRRLKSTCFIVEKSRLQHGGSGAVEKLCIFLVLDNDGSKRQGAGMQPIRRELETHSWRFPLKVLLLAVWALMVSQPGSDTLGRPGKRDFSH